MRKVRANDLVSGMAAAEEVTSEDKLIKLLKKGARLTEADIARIREWRVPFVAIGDELFEALAESGSVGRPEDEFLAIYLSIIREIADAFKTIKKSGEAAITRMRELAEQRIPLLTETVGAFEFLYKIQHYHESTFHHSLNVAVIAGILGKWRGYTGGALKSLILSGLLHDVGKLSIPLAILEKPGPLSPKEFTVIKHHSQEGYQIVSSSAQVDKNARDGILQHHERHDGSGYPAGITGDGICAAAEIIAIADTYDAMTSDRSYRSKVTPFEAIDEIAGEMFCKLDPEVCMTFLQHMRDRLTGCRVILNNGQAARVIGFEAGDKYCTKPVVYAENGELLELKNADLRIVALG